jgi:hypothetical protein
MATFSGMLNAVAAHSDKEKPEPVDYPPISLVRSRRLELPRGFPHKHLKLARLPFRHDRIGQAAGYSG